MKSDALIRGNIMRRVWGVYVLRTLTAPSGRLVVDAVAVFAVAFSVSLKNVAANALSSATSLASFSAFALDAFFSTELAVQGLAVVIALITFSILGEMVARLVSSPHQQLAFSNQTH